MPYQAQTYDYGPTLQIANILGNQQLSRARYAENVGKLWGQTLQTLGGVASDYLAQRQKQPLVNAQIADAYSQIGERQAMAQHYRSQVEAEQRKYQDQGLVGQIIGSSMNPDGSIDLPRASTVAGKLNRSDLLGTISTIVNTHNEAVQKSYQAGEAGRVGGQELVGNVAEMLRGMVGTPDFDSSLQTAFQSIKNNPNAVSSLQVYMPYLSKALQGGNPREIDTVLAKIAYDRPSQMKVRTEYGKPIAMSEDQGLAIPKFQGPSLAGLGGAPPVSQAPPEAAPAPSGQPAPFAPPPPAAGAPSLPPAPAPPAPSPVPTPPVSVPPPLLAKPAPNSLVGMAQPGVGADFLIQPSPKLPPEVSAILRANGISPRNATEKQILGAQAAIAAATRAPKTQDELDLIAERLKAAKEDNAPLAPEILAEVKNETSRGDKWMTLAKFSGTKEKNKALAAAAKEGIHVLDANEASLVNGSEGMLRELDGLKAEMKRISTKSPATRPFEAVANWIKTTFQLDPERSAFLTSNPLMALPLLGSLMEKGKNMRMTQAELNIAAKSLPTMNDTWPTALQKINRLKNLIAFNEDRVFGKKVPASMTQEFLDSQTSDPQELNLDDFKVKR